MQKLLSPFIFIMLLILVFCLLSWAGIFQFSAHLLPML